MDPETIRLAQEQMSRIPPEELMRMQQQMLSNPELLRMATASMSNMRPQDFRFAAEQMRNLPADQIAQMSAQMANVRPEDVASLNNFASSQQEYEYQGALALKNQGNQLHGNGNYKEAIEKYVKAKSNLAGLSSSEASSLRQTCALNLMSCYLKTSQLDKAVREGSEVLAKDPKNLKALYRRGQAYKELRQLRLAVADLRKAADIAPYDETVVEVLRQAEADLENVQEQENVNEDGPIIEEITEDEAERLTSNAEDPEGNLDERPPQEALTSRMPSTSAGIDPALGDVLSTMQRNPEMLRTMQSLMSTVDPEQMAAMSGGRMTPELAKMAASMMKNMSPSDLETMIGMARQARPATSELQEPQQSSSPPLADLGMPAAASQLRNDPAMKQMMATMIQSMTPESMASMSEQLGMKLTPEQAVEAQKAMSRLTPDQLDSLMRWAERAQTVTEQAKRAKAWLMGKPGLILAIVMLLIAVVLHYFGFIGR